LGCCRGSAAADASDFPARQTEIGICDGASLFEMLVRFREIILIGLVMYLNARDTSDGN
jgi:hypothetical protein